MSDKKNTIEIPLREIWFEFSHSGGPGGQNVNKVSTQATLCWSPAASSVLDQNQKRRVFAALGRRISADGVLRVTARESRSQARNRELALERLRELLAAALRPARRRVPTAPSRASRERRLAGKQARAKLKRERGDVRDWD